MPGYIIGRRLVDELVKHGILDNPDTITRVTIDIPAQELPRIYVERVGDKRLLHIVPAIKDGGLEIETVEALSISEVEVPKSE